MGLRVHLLSNPWECSLGTAEGISRANREIGLRTEEREAVSTVSGENRFIENQQLELYRRMPSPQAHRRRRSWPRDCKVAFVLVAAGKASS